MSLIGYYLLKTEPKQTGKELSLVGCYVYPTYILISFSLNK